MNGRMFVGALALLLCIVATQAGVSYIRWGRTKCPDGNILLYKGLMTTRHWQRKGSGANTLCTNENPQFVRGTPGFQDGAGKIWGVEFEKFSGFQTLFQTSNIPNGDLHNQEMVCVRCYVSGADDVFMMPGRPNCDESGYTLQYKGFLVSEAAAADRQSQEYICLDEAPEGKAGDVGNNEQAVVYPVEFECGSLPCYPFVNGMEATCAVCAY